MENLFVKASDLFPKTKEKLEEFRKRWHETEASFRKGYRHGFDAAIDLVNSGKTVQDLCDHFNFLGGDIDGIHGEGWFWRGWQDSDPAPRFPKDGYKQNDDD